MPLSDSFPHLMDYSFSISGWDWDWITLGTEQMFCENVIIYT